VAEIEVVTYIPANRELCFDLARDLDLHVRSQQRAGERAVAGRTSGLIELGEWVTWEAKHLGVRQRLTSRITAFDRPRYFQDTMVSGAFRSFVHDHTFLEDGPATLMLDRVMFESPFGVIGRLFNLVFLSGYMRRLIGERAAAIKAAATQSHQT
jgi:ligand-binding SRPBCC domain-containing protein